MRFFLMLTIDYVLTFILRLFIFKQATDHSPDREHETERKLHWYRQDKLMKIQHKELNLYGPRLHCLGTFGLAGQPPLKSSVLSRSVLGPILQQ